MKANFPLIGADSITRIYFANCLQSLWHLQKSAGKI
jgi:hypothetical protein